MALEGQHPAYGLVGTEHVQALAAALQGQQLAAAQAAAAETQARAADRVVEPAKEVAGATIQADARGPHSFERPPQGHGPKHPPEDPPPPDPAGRGRTLDVRA